MSKQHTNAIAIFCEDIREEKIGTETLIGVLPDNVLVPNLPAAFPKLAVYVRIHIDPAHTPKKVGIKVEWPWESPSPSTEFTHEVITDAAQKAKEDSAPLFGLISRFQINNAVLLSEGTIRVIANLDGKEWVCGLLNIHLSE